MKKLIMLVAAILPLTACAPAVPTVFYNYKSGESNFYAAQSVCQGKALAAAPAPRTYSAGQDCQPDYLCQATTKGRACPHICKPIVTSNTRERRQIIQATYQRCITELGWLPCSQGGHGRPECACLNPGPDGKPRCR